MVWKKVVKVVAVSACPKCGNNGFDPEPGTGGLKPYLHVRRDLWAKVNRPVFYELVALGEERDVDGTAMFGVASQGAFFAMAPAGDLKEFA